MVPVWVQTPPRMGLRSISATCLPSLAAWIAAFCPAGPLPITTISTCFTICILSESPASILGRMRGELHPAHDKKDAHPFLTLTLRRTGNGIDAIAYS